MSAESKKRYAISLEDIEEGLASSMGCLATDQITVEGMKVGYMYRESPLNEFDSGWRFFSGYEDEEYMANSKNHDIYALNTIANYDTDIIRYLDKPVGSEYERDQTGSLVIARTH